jgi:formylglycine-generating enzyme required for sulfatase activity
MARDPVERYASMKDFAAALTEFLRAPKPAGRETDTSDKMFAELSQLKLETPTPIDRHMRHPDAGLIGQAKRYAASVKSLVELGRRLPVWGWLVIACSLVGIVLFAGFIRIPTPERLGSIGLSDSEAEIDEKAGRANEALVHQINVLEPRKDRDDNGLRLKLVHCPEGDILTGLFNDSSHDESKKPPLKVELNEFWLGKYEVTQAQWRQVMNTEPWEGHGDVRDGADHPVSYVDWYDASDFCREFTIQERAAGRLPEGWEYSLPTADQWEYACRAGTVTDFSFGNDEANLDDYAWFNGNTEGIGEGYAHPAGKKTANSWGLHDMHGNVWEWCRSENGTIPAVDRATADSNNENSRDVRGGSWRDASAYCRLTYRGRYNSRVKFSAVGFRVALIAKADRSIDAVAQVAAEVPENLDRKPLFRLGQWHVEGDALIKSGDGWGILQFGDPLWQDYDFSFEVVKTAGPYGAAGRFRFLDQKNYMEFDLGAGGNTIYGAATFVDRKGSFNRVKRNVSMEQDRKYRMLIKARKNHFTCYLDDEMIFDYEDDRLSHGPVGFVACQTSARFSSIRVTDPDGRVLWEGLPRFTDSGD